MTGSHECGFKTSINGRRREGVRRLAKIIWSTIELLWERFCSSIHRETLSRSRLIELQLFGNFDWVLTFVKSSSHFQSCLCRRVGN